MAALGNAKVPMAPPQLHWNAQQLTVVAVIDTHTGDQIQDRQCAFEEVEQAVHGVGANFQRVPVSVQCSISFALPSLIRYFWW